jgi:DNA ligase-1
MIEKPMLAGKCSDINNLKYPVLATPKLDGIRCLIIQQGGQKVAVSRNFKPIPNEHVRERLERICPVGFDGELVVPEGTFQQTSSAIMSRDGEPDFEYQVFDWLSTSPTCGYDIRVTRLEDLFGKSLSPSDPVRLVLPDRMSTPEELEEYEQHVLSLGFEGVMVRDPYGPYKFGRSTEKEGWLLKIKRFSDSEAVIVGIEEKMHNANEAKLDELGRTKRSSHKANLTPMDTLGSLTVVDIHSGVRFNIGSGFDDETRKTLWNCREFLRGMIVKYKYQPTGVKEAPRFPIYLGLRSSLPTERS